MSKTRQKAFTLVEMMAVVVIIAILAAVIAPKFFGQVGKTQIVAARQDIENIKKAVTMFKFDTNRFPESLRDLVKRPDNDRGWNGPYLEEMKKDPWDNDYQYDSPGKDDREFDVWSLGQDGKDGGEGADADILGWSEEQ